jgi:predicted PurR-regulated permease PerM
MQGGRPVRGAQALALPYKAVLLALGLVAAGLLLSALIDIVLLLAVTVVIALPVAAGASRLERLHIPRVVGAPMCLLAGLGVIAVVLVLIVPSLVSQVRGFAHQLPSTVTQVEHSIDHALGLRRGEVAAGAQHFVDRYTQHPTRLLGPLSSVGLGAASVVGLVVVMLIAALYAAINPAPLVRGFVALFPPVHRSEALEVLARVRAAWLGWIRGIGLDMLVLGGLLFLGMRLVGLPFAGGFAVFSAAMTVIPNYGSVISAIPPIAFGLAHSLNEGILVTVVYIVVNQVEGNVALPLIMGRSVRLHPAAIAFGVLITGSLFGPLGLVLAVPLISLALILVEELWIKRQERAATAAAAVPNRQRAVLGAIVLGALLIGGALVAEQLITLLLLIMFTVIVSLPLGACADALGRRGVPRPIGALVGLLAGIGFLGGLLALLAPRLAAQARVLVAATPGIVHSLELKLSHLTGERPGHIAGSVEHYVSTYVHDPSGLLGPIASVSLSAAAALGALVIAVMTAYYIAARPQPLMDALVRLAPPPRRGHAVEVLQRIRSAWIGWLKGLAVSMAIIGVLLYIALGAILGLRFALAFATISALAEVVPYLGALASGIPPVAYALTISPGKALAVLAVYVAIHQVEANVIGPIVMSRAVRMHPAVIAIGVVAVGELLGFLGLIVAVPILVAVQILADELWVRRLEPRAGASGGANGAAAGAVGEVAGRGAGVRVEQLERER